MSHVLAAHAPLIIGALVVASLALLTTALWHLERRVQIIERVALRHDADLQTLAPERTPTHAENIPAMYGGITEATEQQ